MNDINENIKSIIKYIKNLVDIDCNCEYVNIPEEDGSFYKVTIPSEYQLFKRSIALDLIDRFSELNIVCTI